MIIDLKSSYTIINEALDTSLSAAGVQQLSNRFTTKPEGIVIEDTVNNLAMPIPKPILDNNKINLPLIYEQYIGLYTGDTNNYNGALPWHYVIEFYQNDYLIYNTRPLDMKYPYSLDKVNKIVKANDYPILNDYTKQVLDNGQKNIENMIHVLIIGNSSLDVYAKKLYAKLGDYIIGPISRSNRFAPTLHNNIIPFNLGQRFLANVLIQNIKS
jgi:hypothetical protein